MSSRKLPQTTDADTAEAASDSPSLAKESSKSKARKLPALPSAVTAKRAVGETHLSDEERTRLEREIRKPILPRVIRPYGFAVPDDLEAIERENALMEERHEKAVTAARREMLKLLCRRYSLAEDDYEGLALALAIDHEPGFQAVNRQIAEFPLADDNLDSDDEDIQFSGLVRIKDGKLVETRSGRPVVWPPERLLRLLEAVEAEKKKFHCTALDAIKRLAKTKEWAPPPEHRSNSTRGEYEAWVQTLQSRLHDAKKLKREAEALFEEIRVLGR